MNDIMALFKELERTKTLCNIKSLTLKIKELNDRLAGCKTEADQAIAIALYV